MKRRAFLKKSVLAAGAVVLGARPSAVAQSLDPALAADWLKRWKKRILDEARDRYCDREMGEELGWLMSPFLNGFYYGYLATNDVDWVARFADWTDSWLKRGVKDPSGFVGWPKIGEGAGQGNGLLTDSMLGEAMAFRPVVLMAGVIQRSPALAQTYGARAERWLDAAAQNFEKWNSFDAWREVKEGGLWVVPEFGVDRATGQWTDGYAKRSTTGFSNPDNKENYIARWLLALHDVTGKPIYRERAEKWFRLMKSRMHTRQDGKFFVWNYWEPAGPWDFEANGSTRHWVGVHPNGGYYEVDLEGIVAAFERGLVFSRDDISRLIATNRDYMWNQRLKDAHFQRIDGGPIDPRWEKTPGTLWASLIPYDATLRQVFLDNFDPGSWEGLCVTPWFLSLKNG